jgi:hypothetical protein
MCPRRARRRSDDARPLRTEGVPRVESHPDGEWVVRDLTGESAAKTYRCPGCDQEIRPGQPHLVAWRAGEEDWRRHWHRPCWVARDRRGPRG